MQIIGKVQIQGREKEIALQEENTFFKYYSLELIGVYTSQIEEQEIVFKKEIALTQETKMEIIKRINDKVKPNRLSQRSYLFEVIGEIEIEGKQKKLVVKKENEIMKYYYLNLIGVFTPKMPGEVIIFKQDTLENAMSSDIKDNAQRSHLSSLEKERIKEFLQKIKILEILDRYNMQQRGAKKQTSYHTPITKNNLSHQKEEKEKIKNQQTPPQKIENKPKDITIKQEVDMDTRVTDKKNLEQVLQKDEKIPTLEHGDEPLKMGIIESDDVKNLKDEKGEKKQGHTSRYEAVMITKQGEVKSLNLENDTQEGTNPLENNYQVQQNGHVQKGDVLTRLQVGEGTIGIEKGQYGEVEVYHSPRKTIGGNAVEGNKSLDRQLETTNAKNAVKGTDIRTLQLAQEYQSGYRSVEQGYQEVETHKRQFGNCEPKSVEDIDGDQKTKSHTHETEDFVALSSGEKITYQELASRWGFYKEGKPDATFIKERFSQKKQEDKKNEDIIDELEEEYLDPRVPRQER